LHTSEISPVKSKTIKMILVASPPTKHEDLGVRPNTGRLWIGIMFPSVATCQPRLLFQWSTCHQHHQLDIIKTMLEGSDKVNNNFKVLISHFKNLYGGPPPKATSLDRPSFICTEIVNCPNQERPPLLTDYVSYSLR
jgi:hypothetical protein